MNTSTAFDPFRILGVPKDASEDEVCARYLELVKKFPPEREPERFREIRAAFESAKDPLLIAQRLLVPPSTTDPPQWSDALEEQKRRSPALSPTLLLSLGNRGDASDDSEDAGESSAADERRETDDHPNQQQHFVEQPHE